MANARPAIVIGIGGTGAWVLSWLKKDLLETYGSLENEPIRLLLIDTADVIADVGAANNQNQAQQNGQQAAPGYSRYIIIDRQREYVQIPTDPNDKLTRDIKASCLANEPGVEHISRWFEAGFYPDAVLRLKDGAGQFRQLGRLAMMQGLHLNGGSDNLYATISNMIDAITRIAAQTGSPGSIDVHIAGSLLGGTGSGLFIDVAWLVRSILAARGDQIQPFITGFFALPGAFSAQPRLDTRMKAFAAWRELNRMMTVRERESEFQVRWGLCSEAMFQVSKEVYDHVYLVDKGVGMPGTPPEASVFPVMAEAISFYLDSEAGVDYIQHIRTNLVNPKQTAPRRGNPTYSVLYVKSWKLPTYHNLRVARHEFARELLRRLLQVVEEKTTNYTNPDQARTSYSIKSDPLYRNRANEVLNAPMQDTGTSLFLDDLASIAQIAPSQWNEAAVQRAGFSYSLLSVFAQMPETQEGKAIQNTLNEAIYFAVPDMIDSNSNPELESYLDGVYRLLYGVKGAGGEYIRLYGDFTSEAFKGKLYDDLIHAQRFHVEVFARRVRFWVQNTLNQPSDERFSGLACVRDAINQLVFNLSEAVRFYIEVKARLAPINEMQSNADAQYGFAAAEAAKRGPLVVAANIAGMGAKREIRLYTEHENANLATKRDHRAVERIITTIRLMHQHLETEVVPRINALVQQLVTDNDFSSVTGLYRGLLDSLADETERHAYDLRLREVTEVLDVPVRVGVDSAKIDELLRRTRWSIDDSMNLRVEIQVSLDPSDPPITLESNIRDPRKTTELVNRLVDGVASYVVFADDSQTAMSVMGVNRLNSALPNLVNQHLHNPSPQRAGAISDIRTFYVRAAATQSETQEIDRALNDLSIARNSPNTVKRVQSNNRNKVTVFSARELLLPESFAEWTAARSDYRDMIIGVRGRSIVKDFERVRNDHLFAAEREALRLEYQAYNDGQTDNELPILDQRLVHLMEEHQNLDRFLTMWAFGWVVAERENQSDADMVWRLRLPDDYGVPLLGLAPRNGTDMLGVMARFCIYGRTLQGRDLPYTQLAKIIDTAVRQVRVDRAQAEQLLQIYNFEAEAASAMNKEVADQFAFTEGNFEPDTFKPKLDKAAAALNRPTRYVEANNRRTLAEEIAYDFTRFDANAAALVTNITAHRQALSILLRLKFTNMARLLNQIINQG